MIISHRLKFAFFRIPKAAGTSIELVLRMSGALNETDIFTEQPVAGFPAWNINTPITRSELAHMTPTDAVGNGYITGVQLEQYSCFATLRSPLDRYVSALKYSHGDMAMPGFLSTILRDNKSLGILEKPASDYFYYEGQIVCEPLMFDDLDNEIRRVLTLIGGYEPPIFPRLNTSRGNRALDIAPDVPAEDWFDPEARATFDVKMAGDIALYNELKGNPNG